MYMTKFVCDLLRADGHVGRNGSELICHDPEEDITIENWQVQIKNSHKNDM